MYQYLTLCFQDVKQILQNFIKKYPKEKVTLHSLILSQTWYLNKFKKEKGGPMTPLRAIFSLSTFFCVPLSMPLPSRFSIWFFHPLDFWHFWFTLSENFCLCWQARVLFSLIFLLFSYWYTQQLILSFITFFIYFFFYHDCIIVRYHCV